MTERRSRILGKMMSENIGKNVVLVGNLTKVNSTGDSAEITTTDNIKVNVSFDKPLECGAEGILEVWGTVKSKGTLHASIWVHFDAENSAEFDGKAYNEFILLLEVLKDQRWIINDGRGCL